MGSLINTSIKCFVMPYTEDEISEIRNSQAKEEKLKIFTPLEKKTSTNNLGRIIENNKNKEFHSMVPSANPSNLNADMTPAQRRYSRRLSVAGQNINKRKSVDVRKSTLQLSHYDELSPLAMPPARGSFFGTLASDTINEEMPGVRRYSRRVSHRAPFGSPSMISPMQNAAVEEDDKVSETKIKTLRKMSVKVTKQTTSKEELKIRRTFRLFIIFWSLAMSGAIYGIVRYILAKEKMKTTENIVIIILQYILTMFAVITPKSILTKAFRDKVEKGQRFQNLRNVFLEKEIDEINKKLQNNVI